MYRAPLLSAILIIGICTALPAQVGGRIIGQVTQAGSAQPVPGAEVLLDGRQRRVVADSAGRFVMLGVPAGAQRLVVRHIGYHVAVLAVSVSAADPTVVAVELLPAQAVVIDAIRVVARPFQPIDQPGSVQVVEREQIQATPVTAVAEVLELQPGVTEGHFRGGRLGQATLRIDGLDVRDQFALTALGSGLDLSPTAIEEVAVTTGGLEPDVGNAVSGVVNIVTRRGNPVAWRLDGALFGGRPLPASLGRGYTRYEMGAGGPLRLLGSGATLRLDGAATAAEDADPRREGLTCLTPEATDACVTERPIVPHHRGDYVSLTSRLDLPFSTVAAAAITGIWVREQEELYSARFKYNLADYLAERRTSAHVALSLQWQKGGGGGGATLFQLRAALTRTGRFLGVPEAGERPAAAGLPFGRLAFRGEDFIGAPLPEQIASGAGVPGYQRPEGGPENPYGRWGEDLFITRGTSSIVQRHRSDALTLDVAMTTQVNPQHVLQLGAQLKLLHLAAYERAAAWAVGATPSAVSFYPRVAALYAANTLHAVGDVTVTLGLRLEAFDPSIEFTTDRRTIGAPTGAAGWSTHLMPRVGFATPLALVGLPHTVARWNFGLASQPPAFQFFFDTAIDDSLNTQLRRQGNPTLGFERATQYEGGITHQLGRNVLLGLTGYYKDLTGLVTSGVPVGAGGRLFSNLDHGRVEGAEVSVEWRPSGHRLAISYSWQRAFGTVATAFDSTGAKLGEAGVEVPLSFDRRHAIDAVAYGVTGAYRWATTVAVLSGTPIPARPDGRRLPWSVLVNVRAGRTILARALPNVAVFVEGRNLLNWRVLRTARPETGDETVDVAALDARALSETAGAPPIPRESPDYAVRFDRDGDGLMDAAEQYAARRAALLDAADPSLFFGPPRTLRIGLTIGR